jgi:hypothetical protein
MKYFLWAIVAGVCLYVLHRIALWAEDRGWIFYRHKGASGGTLGTALLELQTILEPTKRHVVEERVSKGPATQESGDGNSDQGIKGSRIRGKC